MKKKKILMYFLSGLIPTLLFFICSCINGFIPLKDHFLNVYDSFTQYSGMLLEYKNLLLNGNIFYSWNAGLGFNFFGTITYYGASPLNLLCIFANETNYPYWFAGMTYLRFFLLGLSMCFYLDKRRVKSLYVVLFSSIYALIGFTSAYYYNYLWIDSIIMLPLVIHGLDKLIDGKKPTFYIVSLTFTIMINYYIGFMICIFSLIYFIYRVISIDKKKNIIKRFIISSLLSGLMAAVIILPSYFALKTGKAELYSTIDYSGTMNNYKTFLYSMTSGTFQTSDQSYGPAQIYSSILVLVLVIFYFFNDKYSKKEKIATLLVILLFYASFSIVALNYAWQFFQKPIWWQSRFSFTFSFFMIITAADVLMNIDKVKFKNKHRIIMSIIVVALILLGAYFKWEAKGKVETYTYFYLGLSILIFLEIMFLVDKKGLFSMILLCTFIDLSINTFNNLKAVSNYKSLTEYKYLRDELPEMLSKLDEENDSFYRFELMDNYTSDDGLYFGYHGINYFNSVRNIKVVELMEKLGLYVADKCHMEIRDFNPVYLSIFNVKYLYGEMQYFEKIDSRLYENPYPLALGFTASDKIKYLDLNSSDPDENLNTFLNYLVGKDINLYKKIDHTYFDSYENALYDEESDEFQITGNSTSSVSYTFKSSGHYMIIPSETPIEIEVNDKIYTYPSMYIEVKDGDTVTVRYILRSDKDSDEIYFKLLDLDEYSKAMELLSTSLLESETYKNGHILEGTIDVKGDNTYMFTSIEYEKGMKIYVDGKEIEPDLIEGVLIGFDLSSGEHEIVIDYVPQGFKLGLIISCTSLILTCLYLQKVKKEL